MPRPLGERQSRLLERFSELTYENPFGPRRVSLEREILGRRHRHVQDAWALRHGDENPNVEPLGEMCHALLTELRDQKRVATLETEPRERYRDLVRYYLYYRFDTDLTALANASLEAEVGRLRVPFFKALKRELSVWLDSVDPTLALDPAHLLACMFQVRRAFALVYGTILGASAPIVALRAAIWESIFTHDVRRYQRSLYDRMHQIPTLVTGPSGSGKELVARAIGLSRYVPFDAQSERFLSHSRDFHALNVAALSPTVVESELFGHTRGAFTDAVKDRSGWLELTGPHGTLFLDEIGELALGIQVKLLRVLQMRSFTRVGDTAPQRFEGKLIVATNRELSREIEAGRFRSDLYYRLCADVVQTPSLHAQLHAAPDDLRALVGHMLRGLLDAADVEAATAEVLTVIERDVGSDYPWPGNVRELEQCVRAILVRARYRPSPSPVAEGLDAALRDALQRGLSADALLDTYCRTAHARLGSYSGAAEALGLDRRTVKARVHLTDGD